MAEIEMTEQERAALQHLIDLARHVDHALDDSEEVQEDGLRSHIIQAQDFDDVVEAIDALNDLPDDKPGVTMNPSDKAEWALRRILVRHIATAPAAVAGPLNELEELNLLNKLIALGAKAAHAHAQSNSDDGHKGTAAYVQWQELRAEMGELIRNAYAAPTAQPAPQQEAQEPVVHPRHPAAVEWPSDSEIDALVTSIGPTEGIRKDSRDLSMSKLRMLVRRALATWGQVKEAPAAQGDALDADLTDSWSAIYAARVAQEGK